MGLALGVMPKKVFPAEEKKHLCGVECSCDSSGLRVQSFLRTLL